MKKNKNNSSERIIGTIMSTVFVVTMAFVAFGFYSALCL